MHSHPQGNETPLLAQRTRGIGVGLVPALCSCSCDHSDSYLAPQPRLLAHHRATGGLCLKGNSIMMVLCVPASASPLQSSSISFSHTVNLEDTFWGTLYTSSSLPRKNSPCVGSHTMIQHLYTYSEPREAGTMFSLLARSHLQL